MGVAMQQFPPQRDYSSLSIADLLDARDAWHVHLTHLQNVVATAIGKYRILKDDWYYDHPPQQPRPADRKRSTEPRTLENSAEGARKARASTRLRNEDAQYPRGRHLSAAQCDLRIRKRRGANARLTAGLGWSRCSGRDRATDARDLRHASRPRRSSMRTSPSPPSHTCTTSSATGRSTSSRTAAERSP